MSKFLSILFSVIIHPRLVPSNYWFFSNISSYIAHFANWQAVHLYTQNAFFACWGSSPIPQNHENKFSWSHAIRLERCLRNPHISSFPSSVSSYSANSFSHNFVTNSGYSRCRKFFHMNNFSNILGRTWKRFQFNE